MGVGAILYSEYLNAKYNVFGTILEASNFAFRKKLTIHNAINTMPFSGLGLMDIRLMNGLTEVGTAIIATYYGSDIVEQSLESLATNGSEKKKRKELLLKIVCNKFNRDIKIPESLEPKNKIKLGTNLALDFLCLYILKNMGIDAVHKTMSELPEEIIKFAENHELSFYEMITFGLYLWN